MPKINSQNEINQINVKADNAGLNIKLIAISNPKIFKIILIQKKTPETSRKCHENVIPEIESNKNQKANR